MTDTQPQTKKVNWSEPRNPESKHGRDWGTYDPPTLVEVDPPEVGEIPSGIVAGQLMAAVYSHFAKGDLTPWRWLTSPDLGANTDSFSRPDLIPILSQLAEGIELLKDALLHGPRRTVWDPEIEAWRIVVPSATQEAEYRKAQKGNQS